MRKSIGFYVFILVFVFTSGVSIKAQVRTRTFSQAPVFQSVSPNPLKLTRGGPWSSVQVNGTGLQQVKGIRVLLNHTPTRTILARLHRSWPRIKSIRFKAMPTARTGKHLHYNVRLLDEKGQILTDIPPVKFFIIVGEPSGNRPGLLTQKALANRGVNPTGTTIHSGTLNSLTLSIAMIQGGETISGQVRLSRPLNNDAKVSLTSSKSYLTDMPAQISIPAGRTSRTFEIKTGEVVGEMKATITAAYGYDRRTAELTLVGPPRLYKAKVMPTSICIGDSGTFTITTWSVAGKDTEIRLIRGSSKFTLTNTTPQAVGEIIVLPYGKKAVSAIVNTAGVLDHAISTSIHVELGQDDIWSEFSLHPPGVLNKISFGPVIDAQGDDAFLFSGHSFTGYVILNHYAGSGGVTINLSSNSSVATVPATVTVAKGEIQGDFTVTHSKVQSDTIITITATQGSISKSRSILLKP